MKYTPAPGTWFKTPQWPSTFPFKCKSVDNGKVLTICGYVFDLKEVYMEPFDMKKLTMTCNMARREIRVFESDNPTILEEND